MSMRIIIILFFLPLFINSQCIQGDCIIGFGKIFYEENNSYEGHFKNGLKNGEGTLIEYTDEYKITTKGLFVDDRIVQGEKIMKNLKVPLEAFISITSYSRLGGKNNLKNAGKSQEDNPTNAKEIFDIVGETNDLSICEITVFNSHGASFILKLGQNSYEFKAKETRTISIEPGNYSIHASSIGVRPYIGEIELQGGKKYFRRYYVYTISK
mgnify:CR=1 FL=1